jgi:hypothetical protein
VDRKAWTERRGQTGGSPNNLLLSSMGAIAKGGYPAT